MRKTREAHKERERQRRMSKKGREKEYNISDNMEKLLNEK